MAKTKTIANVNNVDKRAHLFQPGNTAAKGKKGRGKAKFSGQFIDDLTREWHDRGCQALQELTGKELVNTAVQVLPKDVLHTIGQTDGPTWVINAQPTSLEDWSKSHGITHDNGTDIPLEAPTVSVTGTE